MALPVPSFYSRVRPLLPELIRFGIVGGIGTVVDLGGAAVLHGKYHVEPLVAKAISTSVSTMFAYLGCRFWTFKHRENQDLRREALLFIALNLVGLFIAELVVGFESYVLNLQGQLAYNAASLIGTGLGTIFRYFAYKKWVFLAPTEQPESAAAGPAQVPDYPPWELDPAYLAAEVTQRAAARQSAMPSYSLPWGGSSGSGLSPVPLSAPVPALAAEPRAARSPEPEDAMDRPPLYTWTPNELDPPPAPRPARTAGRHRRS
jgi:putative flippase GtrA